MRFQLNDPRGNTPVDDHLIERAVARIVARVSRLKRHPLLKSVLARADLVEAGKEIFDRHFREKTELA